MKITVKQLREHIRQQIRETWKGGWPPPGWKADKEDKKDEIKKETPLSDRLSRGVKNVLSPKEDSFVRDFATGKTFDLPRNLMAKLMDYYRDEMPYGTQKARDGDPYEWLRDRLEPLYATSMGEAGHDDMIDSITKVSDAVRKHDKGGPQLQCLECNARFKSAGRNVKCPRCGGDDIDLAVTRESAEHAQLKEAIRRLVKKALVEKKTAKKK